MRPVAVFVAFVGTLSCLKLEVVIAGMSFGTESWGRLRPFELQPPGRIGEGGQGQMSRRGSTVPHLGRVREGIVCRFDHFV